MTRRKRKSFLPTLIQGTLDRVELVERNDSNELQYAVIEFRHGYLGYPARSNPKTVLRDRKSESWAMVHRLSLPNSGRRPIDPP